MEDTEEAMTARPRPGAMPTHSHPVSSNRQKREGRPQAAARPSDDVIVLEDDPTPEQPHVGAHLCASYPTMAHTIIVRNF